MTFPERFQKALQAYEIINIIYAKYLQNYSTFTYEIYSGIYRIYALLKSLIYTFLNLMFSKHSPTLGLIFGMIYPMM